METKYTVCPVCRAKLKVTVERINTRVHGSLGVISSGNMDSFDEYVTMLPETGAIENMSRFVVRDFLAFSNGAIVIFARERLPFKINEVKISDVERKNYCEIISNNIMDKNNFSVPLTVLDANEDFVRFCTKDAKGEKVVSKLADRTFADISFIICALSFKCSPSFFTSPSPSSPLFCTGGRGNLVSFFLPIVPQQPEKGEDEKEE